MAPGKVNSRKKSSKRKRDETIYADDETIFDAECILTEKVDDEGRIMYLVKWENYDVDDATWLPDEDIGDDLLKEWEAEKKVLNDAERNLDEDGDATMNDAEQSTHDVAEGVSSKPAKDDCPSKQDDEWTGPVEHLSKLDTETDTVDVGEAEAGSMKPKKSQFLRSEIDCIISSAGGRYLLLKFPDPVTGHRSKPFWRRHEKVPQRFQKEWDTTQELIDSLLPEDGDRDLMNAAAGVFSAVWRDAGTSTGIAMSWPRAKGSLWLSQEKFDIADGLVEGTNHVAAGVTIDDLTVVFPDEFDVGMTLAEYKKLKARMAEENGEDVAVDGEVALRASAQDASGEGKSVNDDQDAVMIDTAAAAWGRPILLRRISQHD